MEDNRMIECIERAHYILSNLMAVKPGEEVLIAIDPQDRHENGKCHGCRSFDVRS